MSRLAPEAYFNQDSSTFSISKVHRLLFALAMNGILSTGNRTPVEALKVTRSKFTLTVLKPLVIIVQAFLGICVVCVALLLLLLKRKPSNLLTNPASLSDLAALLPSTRPTSEHFQQPFIVSTAAAEPHFALIKRQTQLAPAQMSYRSLDQSPAASGRSIPSKIYKRPSYLAPLSGLAFVTLFLALLVTLILLKIFITRNTGLSLPSTNSVGTQIIIIYIPVVISTLIEPYWTLLNRQLCVSQPLKELKACRATAAHSLNLSYSSVPPQFNVLRAARAKHYLLATICVIALVANVLSVGLGELLNAGIAMPENTVSLAAKTKPLLNATAPVDRIIDFRELFYVAHSILSAQTDPPAWTTKEAYFLPTSLDIDGDLLQDITIPTTGFSALSSCAEATVSNETYREDVISFSTTVITLTGDPVECYFSQIVNPVMYQDTEKHAAIDTLAPLIPSKADASAYERQTCASALAVVHVRGDRDETNKAALKPTSALHLICQPTLEASDSTVQVSRTDQVIASHHQTEAQSNVSAYLAPGYNITDLYVNLNTIIAWVVLLPGEDGELRSAKYQAQDGTRTALHNDAYAYTWFPYLLTKQLGSPDIVNASQPAPSAANIIPAVQELYRRLAALTFALGQDRFFPFPAAPDTVLPATYHTTETRVLMSDPMFYLCAAILLLDILAATAYYWRATPRRILPYAPTSLASMLSLYEGSSLAPLQGLWGADWRFGFGKFVGTDGQLRIGIERQPFVHPLPDVLAPSDLDPFVGRSVAQGPLQPQQPAQQASARTSTGRMVGSTAGSSRRSGHSRTSENHSTGRTSVISTTSVEARSEDRASRPASTHSTISAVSDASDEGLGTARSTDGRDIGSANEPAASSQSLGATEPAVAAGTQENEPTEEQGETSSPEVDESRRSPDILDSEADNGDRRGGD